MRRPRAAARSFRLAAAALGLVFVLSTAVLYSQMPDRRAPPESLPTDISPSCNITEPRVAHCLARVKTDECRRKILDTACSLAEGRLYPLLLDRGSCPSAEPSRQGTWVGCFADSGSARLFRTAQLHFPNSNSPAACAQTCLSLGAALSGVQYGVECFCGQRSDLTGKPRLANAECHDKKYVCPANASLPCGAYLKMAVRETGFGDHLQRPVVLPKSMEHISSPNSSYPRIVFLLQLNGRSVRQVNRLLKLIYRPQHFYYVHVDSRRDFLYREMTKAEQTFQSLGADNFRVSRRRWATIWGGASLLEMMLAMLDDLLSLWADWDFVLNMSEADLPLVPVEELAALVAANAGRSFLKSHGHNTHKFIRKQAMGKAFVECEERMWRIGDKPLPSAVRLDGGSDWVGLTRELAAFAAHSQLPTITALKTFFAHSLLPAESFFHTAALNGPFCEKVVNSNLKVTNWRRGQGCKCQHSMVDWCGCSPNVFKVPDWEKKLAKPGIVGRSQLTGRKFDAMIDVGVMEMAEQQARGGRAHPARAHPSFHSFWLSIADHRDSGGAYSDLRNALATKAMYSLNLPQPPEPSSLRILSVHAFLGPDEKQPDILIDFSVKSGDRELRSEARFRRRQRWTAAAILDGAPLIDFDVGQSFDLKEEVFRDYEGLLREEVNATVRVEWAPSRTLPLDGLRFVLLDPSGAPQLRKGDFAPISPGNSTRSVKLPGLSAGPWLGQLERGAEVLGRIAFRVGGTGAGDFGLESVCGVGWGEGPCAGTAWSSRSPDPKADLSAHWDPLKKRYL